MREDTSTAPGYVALQDLRFGDVTLKKGEPVPRERGRSYHQMLSLGQIGRAAAPAPAVEAPPTLPVGARVAFVDEDGTLTWGTHLGPQVPDDRARAALHLTDGQAAARVAFPDDPDPVLVSPASLLPEHPTDRLTRAHDARLQEVTDAAEADRAAGQNVTDDLREQVTYLQLLLRAVRTPGEPLPADQPGGRDLAAVGITSREGLLVLAGGEHARQNLTRLEGIGTKTADRILAGLTAPAGGDA
ncbi:hypothetical protein [Deinococcus aquiradiocola]|uniref:Uncharacterized protein n=1 Tax=Deinococcus aquiradiocola TaxID=393059 RepID=A0A917ULC5_9DEIO|nr:hypothetical protein [Deinococcus aquiradiocola]GGJ65319.1 hypothetical protein GCM10008939_06550 [Deinococcus aquiradiocola]